MKVVSSGDISAGDIFKQVTAITTVLTLLVFLSVFARSKRAHRMNALLFTFFFFALLLTQHALISGDLHAGKPPNTI